MNRTILRSAHVRTRSTRDFVHMDKVLLGRSTLRLDRAERGSANSTGSDELTFITWGMLVSIVVVHASGTREKTAIALPRAEMIENS